MKYAVLSVFLLAFITCYPESPETIYPKTKTIRTVEWYAEQAGLWKKETALNRSNASAWYNLYHATRYSLGSHESLREIGREMQAAVPETIEAMIVQALEGAYSEGSYKILNEAVRRDPMNPATYGPLTLFNEYYLQPEARKEASGKLLASGQVSQALLHYSYNVLMSIEENAILFTEGDNTTLPLFILQDVVGVRRDVTILNLDLLTEGTYRDAKLSQSSLRFDASVLPDQINGQKTILCALLPEQNPGRSFYYALTIGKESISLIKEQLYVVGLASRLSRERLDNISMIQKNLEKNFLVDYLTVDFNGENEFAAGRVLSSNYLVSMLLLDQHYIKTGDETKSRDLEKLILKVAEDAGKKEMVSPFLYPQAPAPVAYMKLNTKELEQSYRVIRGNLYASYTEITNLEYNIFLDFLKKNNQTALYETCKIDLSKYDNTLQAFFGGYHAYFPLAKRGKNAQRYNNYPVINIPHAAAVAYCDWLTEQYNASAERKYRKVKFRLPTLKEWRIAALGSAGFQSWELDENTVEVVIPKDPSMEIAKGDPVKVSVKDVLYPWYGAYNYRNKAQNRRNCFLGNFKVPDDCTPCQTPSPGFDGFTMMSPVASYFPNDMGFYDVVGNVAEMIDEYGKACGGSWNNSPEESTIRSVIDYKGPDAAVGFRIFMDVIEK